MAATPADGAEVAQLQQEFPVCPPPSVDSADGQEWFAENAKFIFTTKARTKNEAFNTESFVTQTRGRKHT